MAEKVVYFQGWHVEENDFESFVDKESIENQHGVDIKITQVKILPLLKPDSVISLSHRKTLDCKNY